MTIVVFELPQSYTLGLKMGNYLVLLLVVSDILEEEVSRSGRGQQSLEMILYSGNGDILETLLKILQKLLITQQTSVRIPNLEATWSLLMS